MSRLEDTRNSPVLDEYTIKLVPYGMENAPVLLGDLSGTINFQAPGAGNGATWTLRRPQRENIPSIPRLAKQLLEVAIVQRKLPVEGETNDYPIEVQLRGCESVTFPDNQYFVRELGAMPVGLTARGNMLARWAKKLDEMLYKVGANTLRFRGMRWKLSSIKKPYTSWTLELESFKRQALAKIQVKTGSWALDDAEIAEMARAGASLELSVHVIVYQGEGVHEEVELSLTSAATVALLVHVLCRNLGLNDDMEEPRTEEPMEDKGMKQPEPPQACSTAPRDSQPQPNPPVGAHPAERNYSQESRTTETKKYELVSPASLTDDEYFQPTNYFN